MHLSSNWFGIGRHLIIEVTDNWTVDFITKFVVFLKSLYNIELSVHHCVKHTYQCPHSLEILCYVIFLRDIEHSFGWRYIFPNIRRILAQILPT